MGANIKGPYSLQECSKVGATITTTDATGAAALTVAAAAAGVSITQTDTNSYVFEAVSTGAITGTVNALSRFDSRNASTTKPVVQIDNDSAAIGLIVDLTLGTNSNSAIKITHSGTGADLFLTPRASAGMAAGAEGGIYFNATTHKLMIRGAAGWETVNSA